MSAAWTITYGVVERSLAAWGITSINLTRRSYGADDLTFVIKRSDVLAEPAFPDGSQITLNRDGVAYFIGSIVSSAATFGARVEQDEYLARNAWHELERLVYQQLRCVYDESFAFAAPQPSSHVVLGMTGGGGRYVHTTAAMVEVINFALGSGATITPGPLVGGVDFPLEELRDVTCAEVLRRLGAYTPDSVMWVEYSTGVQVLSFGRRDTLSAVTIDALGETEIISAQIRARPDLKPVGVRFDFVGAESNPDGYLVTRITSQSAGVPVGPGALIATIQLAGSRTDNQAAAPIGLAGEYFASLQATQYEGSLVLGGRDVESTITPGKVLNLTNGRAAWATMRAVVQTVTEDIQAGTRTVEFGPPERIPAQDFVDQLLFARRARLDTNLWSTMTCVRLGPDIDDDGEVPDTGDNEEDNPNKGLDPKDTETPNAVVTGCDEGIMRTLVAKGRFVV